MKSDCEPRVPSNYFADHSLVNIMFLRYFSLSDAIRIMLTDISHFVGTKFSSAKTIPHRMIHVVPIRTPFKVGNAIIALYPILMIYLRQIKRIRDKGSRYQTMNCLCWNMFAQTNIIIPFWDRTGLRKLSHMMRSFLRIAPNLSIFSYRILSLVSFNIFHIFSARGMTAWQKSYLSRAKLLII